MFLLGWIVVFIQFVCAVGAGLFAFCGYVGGSLLFLLTKVVSFIRGTFAVLYIFCDEFYHLIWGLKVSLGELGTLVHSSSNDGVHSVVAVLGIVWQHVLHFCTSTRLHTRLLATQFGSWLEELFVLVRGAFLLIADCVCWLPRKLVALAFGLCDLLVFAISSSANLLVRIVHILIEDIFRLTIGVTAVYLVWMQRHRCRRLLATIVLNIRTQTITLLQRWSTRRRRAPPAELTPATPATPATATLSPSVLQRSLMRADTGQRQRLARRSGLSGVDTNLCVACLERSKSVVILPCRHLCLCDECIGLLANEGQNFKCPMCRTAIQNVIPIYT